MLKIFGKGFIVFLAVFTFAGSIYAFGNSIFSGNSASFRSGFVGGDIVNVNYSKEIEVTEAAGYDCQIPGTIIEVDSRQTGLTSYFIPIWVQPATRTNPAIGQQILGIFGGQTTIVCTRDEWKEGGGGYGGGRMVTSQTNFTVSNLYYFGTSPY